jgi:hypothetical protein
VNILLNEGKGFFRSGAEKKPFPEVKVCLYLYFCIREHTPERRERVFSERSGEKTLSRREGVCERASFGLLAVGCWLLAVKTALLPRTRAGRAHPIKSGYVVKLVQMEFAHKRVAGST